MDFTTLTPIMLERWKKSATLAGIDPNSYNLKVRKIHDSSGKSDFTFGVIFNPHRFERHKETVKISSVEGNNKGDRKTCLLCGVVKEVREMPGRNLDVERKLPGFVVIPNRFPTTLGHTLAIDAGIDGYERPMYTTRNLDGLAKEMDSVFSFGKESGFRIYHNSEGAGASIPNHEHWHPTHFGAAFNASGEKYGFEASSFKRIGHASGVCMMPGYPFAHVVFEPGNTERIVSFLGKLGENIGESYKNGCVPHAICQGEYEVLVVPVKVYEERGLGSGDMAGNIVVKTAEEFDNMSYDYCVAKLEERLFRKDEIDLKNFL